MTNAMHDDELDRLLANVPQSRTPDGFVDRSLRTFDDAYAARQRKHAMVSVLFVTVTLTPVAIAAWFAKAGVLAHLAGLLAVGRVLLHALIRVGHSPYAMTSAMLLMLTGLAVLMGLMRRFSEIKLTRHT